jgi:hypothetical protein
MVFLINRWRYVPILLGASGMVGGVALIYFIQGQTAGPQVDLNFHESAGDSGGLTDTGWFSDNEIVFVELTPSMASRALRGFSLYRERFSQVDLNVQNRDGKLIGNTSRQKVFLNDLKKLEFNSLRAWRSALVTIDFTYNSMTNSDGNVLIENNASSASNRISQDGNIVSEGNRKVVVELLRNEADRALLENLVRFDE